MFWYLVYIISWNKKFLTHNELEIIGGEIGQKLKNVEKVHSTWNATTMR